MESVGQNYKKARYWLELPLEVTKQAFMALGNAALDLVGLEITEKPRMARIEYYEGGDLPPTHMLAGAEREDRRVA